MMILNALSLLGMVSRVQLNANRAGEKRAPIFQLKQEFSDLSNPLLLKPAAWTGSGIS